MCVSSLYTYIYVGVYVLMYVASMYAHICMFCVYLVCMY